MRRSYFSLPVFSRFSVRLLVLLAGTILTGCGSSVPSLTVSPTTINIPQGGRGRADLSTSSGMNQTVVHGRVDGRPASTWPNVLWGTAALTNQEPITVQAAAVGVGATGVDIYVPATETLGQHVLEFNVVDPSSKKILNSETVTVNVTAPPTNGFRMTTAPPSLSFPAGASATTTVTLTAFGSYSGTVVLDLDTLPQGVTAAVSAPTVTLPAGGTATVTLTVTAPANTAGLTTGVTLRGLDPPSLYRTALSVPITITSSGGGGGGGGSTGTVYVSDVHKVLKVASLSNAAYQDTGSQLPISNGSHMYVSANGTTYLADKYNYRILSFSNFAAPNITTVGTEGSGNLQFSLPSAVTLGPDGKIYVADTGNNRIVRMDDMTGAGFITWQPNGTTLSQPECVFVDSANVMYITDTNHQRILRVPSISSGSFQEIGTYGQGVGHFFFPHGIFVQNGRIYVTDPGRIIAMDNITGANWQELNDANLGAGVLNAPLGIFVESSGRITVIDSQSVLSFAGMNGAGKVVWPPAGTTNPLESPVGIYIR